MCLGSRPRSSWAYGADTRSSSGACKDACVKRRCMLARRCNSSSQEDRSRQSVRTRLRQLVLSREFLAASFASITSSRMVCTFCSRRRTCRVHNV